MKFEPQQPAEILLVEDNASDVRLTVEAMKEGRVENNLHVVHDGEQALSFLRREAPFDSAPQPDLILLDLNLPKIDGREVLAEIKAQEELKHIPVVVLTTSTAEEDIRRTYELHANCYIAKPVDIDRFIGVIRRIEDFWLCTVSLPGGYGFQCR